MLQKSKLDDDHTYIELTDSDIIFFSFQDNFNSNSDNSLREFLCKKRGIMTGHYDLPSVQLGLTV